ncbi:nuclear transport factor 2 family protein [Oceanicella sp. SM1341]|uniref:nuclear transport factor 2 family protein n=1 Tax=Oceanicella sp. SM1341 TaxID=1548889 RepID=UPI000E5378E1|nr:nuclear transport factor 2 family protein [Oceanicella sp. SM1341]
MNDIDLAAYEAVTPYFDLVRTALGDLVQGAHFFDIVADEITYEVRYDLLAWPRLITGRSALMAVFKGYGDYITLQSADNLIVHATDNRNVAVLEYEVHGKVLATGRKYDNRFCSIVHIKDRKIVEWRDYMDSFAAWMH